MRAAALRFAAAMAGLPPDRIALIVALGLALGTFPIPGIPTALCAAAAVALRLNFPALQLVNHLSSPLQMVLLVPFARLGSRIAGPHAASAPPQAWGVGEAALQVVAGWLCVAAPLGMVLYFALAWALRGHRREWFNGLESPA